ncbi:MAG: signal peptidase I [Nitrososphaerales archaeon]
MSDNFQKRSRLRYLRYLLYLIPIVAIVVGYGGIIVYTGEWYPFTIVIGPSMQPTILPGSVAVIEKVPFNQLKIGDIIVFEPQEALLFSCQSTTSNSLIRETNIPCFVIHRIVKITNESNGNMTVETKGDNNGYSIPLIDTGINSSMYIGKVVLQFPVAGYITTSPTNEIIAFVILAALATQVLFERRQNQKKETSTEGNTSELPPSVGDGTA